MLKFNINSVLFDESCQAIIREKKPCGLPEVQIDGDVCFDLLATKLDREINIEGKAACRVVFECGRCLERFVSELEVPISYTKEFDWDSEKEVDLDEEFNSGVVLALPMGPICSDDCKGLCSVCGVNSNHNECGCAAENSGFSAFSGLKKIKFK